MAKLTMAMGRTMPRLSGRSVALPPKTVSPHYTTPEHKQWAYAVRCRANNTCENCGRVSARMYADHIIELKDGGKPFDVMNGQCLCGSCHTKKTIKSRTQRLSQNPWGGG